MTSVTDGVTLSALLDGATVPHVASDRAGRDE